MKRGKLLSALINHISSQVILKKVQYSITQFGLLILRLNQTKFPLFSILIMFPKSPINTCIGRYFNEKNSRIPIKIIETLQKKLSVVTRQTD